MATKTQRGTSGNIREAGQSLTSAATKVMKSEPVQDAVTWARDYARKNPESAALWCFGIGFLLAWKIKPW
jgi:hypothetical protein